MSRSQAIRRKISSRALPLAGAFLGLTVTFQNCAQQQDILLQEPSTFSDAPGAGAPGTPGNDGAPTDGAPNTGGGGNGGTPPSIPPIEAIKTLRPAFAVRAMNCFMCHASIGSNVVTDFGFGGANSMVGHPSFGQGDHAYGNSRNAWGSINSLRGTLFVPDVSLSAAQVDAMLGSGGHTAMKLKDALLTSATGLADKIAPVASAPKVAEKKKISIGYPTRGQILGLLPAAESAKSVTVAAVAGRSGQFNGLGLSADNKFIRNISTVVCKGDVVVKGTLFLRDLVLSTDAAGCRLYVSDSVFIQGPIYLVNGSNLQISSARAILMGFSAQRLGASPSGSGRVNATVEPAPGTVPGGPWARFGKAYDAAWDSANAPINGVARTQFFDDVVAEARKIGDELKDAADSSQFGSLPPGVTLTDPTADAGGRMIVDYQGLLLNAPHVHGRYAGQFRGVIIAEAAMLARNPAPTTSLEEFLYDPVFDTLTEVLPALNHVTLLDLTN